MHINRSYFICAVQRSGSNLLCDALTETGLAGVPQEHFLWLRPTHPKHVVIKEKDLLKNPADYIAWIKKIGTSPNGVFSTKVMWDYLGNTIQTLQRISNYKNANPLEILTDLFPNLSFVRLSRRDRLKQAISQVKAAQTRTYAAFVDQEQREQARPFYDPDHIRARLKFIEESEAGWQRFFHHFGIDALPICYEDFSGNLQHTVERILDFNRIDYKKPVALPPPRRKKLANGINEEWERRFLADHPAALEILAA